jgi:MFS family permease
MKSARQRVLAFAFFLAVVTYLDRICISFATPLIRTDLGLNAVDMGWVFGAFTLAYSLFEIPSGWLGDRIGPRRVLTRIVLWWSAFTMLTGAARSFWSLTAIRFLFGAGEAGAFPNMARALSRWFPEQERGRANSVLFFGSRVGGMLAGPLALPLIRVAGWRASFVSFGALGLLWAAAWRRWFHDEPVHDTMPRVSVATPWRRIATSKNLYAICVMYFAYGYGLYFYFTWLPTYLSDVLKLTTLAGGVFASLPFALAGAANLAGGWLTDRLARTHGLRTARCTLGFCGFFGCAVLIAASIAVHDPVLKATLLAAALGSVDLALSACWAVCLDIGVDHAGVITGTMNTVGNIGGFIAPLIVGVAVERWKSWTLPLGITALVYTIGAVAWLFIDPETKI